MCIVLSTARTQHAFIGARFATQLRLGGVLSLAASFFIQTPHFEPLIEFLGDEVIKDYFMNFHMLTTWGESAPQNRHALTILGEYWSKKAELQPTYHNRFAIQATVFLTGF